MSDSISMRAADIGGKYNKQLIDQTRKALENDGKIDKTELAKIKETVLKDGMISPDEQFFIGNLDNQDLVNKLKSADFDPAQEITLDMSDTTLKTKEGNTVNIGSGKLLIKENGKVDEKSLKNLSQLDIDNSTIGDDSRCSCNATAMALAIQGKDSLKKGVENLISELKSRPNGETTHKKELEKLNELLDDINNNTVTQGDISELASLLYEVFDTDKTDKIVKYEDMIKIQKAVGLLPAGITAQEEVLGDKVGHVYFNRAGSPVGSDFNVESKEFKKAQKEAAKDVIDKLKPGETALVGVFNSSSGGTDKPNHIVLVGKNAKGEVFVYDSLAGDKNFIKGKAAEKHLASKIGIAMDNPQVVTINQGGTNVTVAQLDAIAGATFIPLKKKAE